MSRAMHLHSPFRDSPGGAHKATAALNWAA
jgi:hypothetical protein